MKRSALFILSALLWCVSVLDLAKRLPEHLLPEDYSDTLRAEFMEFAMVTDAELPPMDGGLDAFWAAMATRTTAGGDHPFATLSAVMKVYLLMPHHGQQDRHGAPLGVGPGHHRCPSVSEGELYGRHSLLWATRDCAAYVQESHNELKPASQEHTLIAQSLLTHIFCI